MQATGRLRITYTEVKEIKRLRESLRAPPLDTGADAGQSEGEEESYATRMVCSHSPLQHPLSKLGRPDAA